MRRSRPRVLRVLEVGWGEYLRHCIGAPLLVGLLLLLCSQGLVLLRNPDSWPVMLMEETAAGCMELGLLDGAVGASAPRSSCVSVILRAARIIGEYWRSKAEPNRGALFALPQVTILSLLDQPGDASADFGAAIPGLHGLLRHAQLRVPGSHGERKPRGTASA